MPRHKSESLLGRATNQLEKIYTGTLAWPIMQKVHEYSMAIIRAVEAEPTNIKDNELDWVLKQLVNLGSSHFCHYGKLNIENLDRDLNWIVTETIEFLSEESKVSFVQLAAQIQEESFKKIEQYVGYATLLPTGSHAFEHNSKRSNEALIRDLKARNGKGKEAYRTLIDTNTMTEAIDVLFTNPKVVAEVVRAAKSQNSTVAYKIPSSSFEKGIIQGEYCFNFNNETYRAQVNDFDEVIVVLEYSPSTNNQVTIKTIYAQHKQKPNIDYYAELARENEPISNLINNPSNASYA